MCHSKKSPPPEAHDRHVKKIQTRSISSMMKLIKQEEEVEREREIKLPSAKKPPLKPKRGDRESRNRRRKPKYLSLRSSRLSAPNDVVASAVTETDSKATTAIATSTATTTTTRRGQQLNLFPLHPEVTAAEVDHQSDDNVALLFESDGGATLHGLLTSADTATTTTTSTMSSDHDQVEESNYGYHRRRSDVDIVRTAMRRSGGDRSVEKWVCYSELVKEEVELTGTTTTSSTSTCCSVGDDRKSRHQDQRLALKLDYTEVLNAWSEKGSLYVKTDDGEEPPQTVPDLLQDQLSRHLHDSDANIEDLWRVPEGGSGSSTLEKKIQREASLLRYKRKRENRLFSKQIRYEVRKINAEKRPRIKGRFVRSSERQDVGRGSY